MAGKYTNPRTAPLLHAIIRDACGTGNPDRLAVGVRVYYTGDCANHEGRGAIIEHDADTYHVRLLLDDGRTFYVPFAAFDATRGQRFMLETEHEAKREAAIESFRKAAHARREG